MNELVSAGGEAIAIDVINHDQVHAEIQKIIEAEGKIDEIDYEQAKRQFEVNLFGLVEAKKAVLPAMRSQGTGTIVNVSSIGGEVYGPLGAWYNASKFALEGWSDCLRSELKQFGINVVIVEPGVIKTGFADAMDQKFTEDSSSPYKEMKHLIARMMENTNNPSSR